MFASKITTDEVRFTACALTPKRFAGRAALQARASQSFSALAELEACLGIMTPQAKSWLVDSEIKRKREERQARKQITDTLAQRKPGHAVRVHTLRVARTLINQSGIRTTTHGHQMYLTLGQPGASSETTAQWPSQLGLPNSYSKGPVTCSAHTYTVNAEILSAVCRALNESAPSGVVYLSSRVRVRNGRGTSLVVERREGQRWA